MKKEKSKVETSAENERRFVEVLNLRKELFVKVSKILRDHDLDTGQVLTAMVALGYDIAELIAYSNESSVKEVVEDLKEGLDIMAKDDEEVTEGKEG